MFAKAYALARCFTQPVIISTRLYDQTVECTGGAFVVLNDEGWIITAAHLFDSFLAFRQHTNELRAYRKQLEQTEQEINYSRGKPFAANPGGCQRITILCSVLYDSLHRCAKRRGTRVEVGGY